MPMNRRDRHVLLTSSPHPPAVVVGLDNITGLQTARILDARGVAVVGIAADLRHFGSRTNACAHVVESPLSGEPLVAALRELAKRLGRMAVLVPCTDESVRTLSERRGDLAASYHLPLGDHAVVTMLMDKVCFAEHARAAGLAIPHTVVLRNRDEAERAARSMPFPAVLKPPMKTARWLEHTHAKALPVAAPDDLLEVYDRVRDWSDVLLAQEWVAGGEEDLYSCNAYFDVQGRALVTFVARKLRQWPPDIGTSASGEECRNDEVLEQTLRTFGDVGFHGLAYLELKRDARTGRMLIIEPNVGRPTGRSAIAERGGVELVYTAYCDAVGLPIPRTHQRYVGVKWIDVRRDLQAAVVGYRRGRLSVRDWASSVRGPKAHAIWSTRDPLPFAVDLVHATAAGQRLLRTRLRSAASSDDPLSSRTGSPR
jgi:predicted ATP-grasp superfamily ATP-dependent carboligase